MVTYNLPRDGSVSVIDFDRVSFMGSAVCWDKDSTLFDTSHRHYMVPEILDGRGDWLQYAMACKQDVPRPAARVLMKMLSRGQLQIVTSGAHAGAMVPIARQLLDNGFPVDMIRLRPADDNVDGALLKVRMIRQLQEEHGIKVSLFVEDNRTTARVIEEMTDVPVLVINPCFSECSQAIADSCSGNI